ncbi:ATP-binding protein [Candidatus Margulisiibacteriota bacterium]
MKREIYNKLIAWKKDKKKKPLILRGARQVGKTYILQAFAEENYENYLYLNFEEQKDLKNIFEPDLVPIRIIKDLELIYNAKIIPEKTLLIFDEIQECPNALNSFKYFAEKLKEYHLIAAGSLLGVKLGNNKGFPVGKVNFLNLYPLNFYEFLMAIGRDDLKNYLLNMTNGQIISGATHNILMRYLKDYLFVGGMPEVVLKYREEINKERIDYNIIRQIQNDIIDGYILDFAKHATKENIEKISQIWESIPAQLGKENKKFQYSGIKRSARAREYEDALQWLLDAGLVNKVHNINLPELPLKRFAQDNIFKLYFLDTGLLGAKCDLGPKVIINDFELFLIFRGALTENFVCQELVQTGKSLYYWTSDGKAEVDFILSFENNVYPLEVKAGKSKKKRSLNVYREKYKPKILSRASSRNFTKDGHVINYPLYLISGFPELSEFK